MRKPLLLVFIILILTDLLLLLFLLYPNFSSPLRTLFRPKPGSCLVLEERYCHKGRRVYRRGKFVFAGFKLPPHTPIFSPYTGQLSRTPTFFIQKDGHKYVYPGISVNVMRPDNKLPDRAFSAVYFKRQTGNEPDETVKKGEVIGYTSAKKLSAYGNFNLLIGFSMMNNKIGMFSADQKLLEKLFHL